MMDALSEFGSELEALIQRWSERTGGRCDMAIRPTFVDDPPVDGFHQRHRGALMEITLTIADLNRPADLLAAHFPAPDAIRILIENAPS